MERASIVMPRRRTLVGALLFLLGCGGGSDADVTPPPVTDTTAPSVAAVTPSIGAVGVAVDATVTATFSEPVNAATLTTTSVTVTSTGVAAPVAGTVAVSGNSVTFTPTTPLSAATSYTATISTAVKDLAGNALASAYGWTFSTVVPPDVTAPTIVSNSPLQETTNVPLRVTPTVTFSEAIKASTLTTATFTMTCNTTGALVPGNVTISGNTATFVPNAPLASFTQYAMRVLTGVQDLAGNSLSTAAVWSFRTLTVLEVNYLYPADNATGVAQDGAASAGFSLAVDPTTLTPATFTMKPAGGATIGGIVVMNVTNNVAIFWPDTLLLANTRYTATVKGTVRDSAGNALGADTSWTITTGVTTRDVTAPEVLSALPGNGTGIPVGSIVAVTMSERMANRTLNTTSVTLISTDGGAPVAGRLVLYGSRFEFIPSSPLRPATRYTFTIATAAKDVTGNPLASPFVMIFTTAP